MYYKIKNDISNEYFYYLITQSKKTDYQLLSFNNLILV